MNQVIVNTAHSDPWLSDVEAAALVGISKSTFRRGVIDGRFPKPVRLGGLVRWPQSEIFRALEDLKAKRQ
jgi:excisionase family DNA binding protein